MNIRNRLKLFAHVFAVLAGGFGAFVILVWLTFGFVAMELPPLDWMIARVIVAIAFLTATGIALFEAGDDA